ncbi:pilin N-terminal domain-containing protein [Enterococcus hirae]|nr:pilin N-terminal domain-containing protein [Enterococcus hirae]
MKKLLTGLSAMMMLLPIFGAAASPVQAEVNPEPTESSVTIHKQAWKAGESPKNVQNTGEIMSSFDGDPVKNVGFTIFDISDAFYKFIADNKNNTTIPDLGAAALEQIQKDAANLSPTQLEAKYGTPVKKEQKTDDAGVVTFTELPHYNDKEAIAYMAVETSTPGETSIIKKAAPITFAMPVYKIDIDKDGKITYKDEINTDIHFYAKNEKGTYDKEITNDDLKTVKVMRGGVLVDAYSVNFEKPLDYKVTFDLPEDIGLQESLTITDQTNPVPGLTLVGTETIGIAIGEDTVTDLFDIDYDASLGKMTAKASDMDTLKSYGGKTLVLTYKMKLDAKTITDVLTFHENEAIVDVSGGITHIPGPPVFTGGHKVIKLDELSGKVLADAEFIFSRTIDGTVHYGKFNQTTIAGNKANIYRFEGWTTTKEDATPLITASNGEFYLLGLQDEADYELTETKAPSDKYVLLKNNVPFAVNNQGKELTIGDTTIKNTPKSRLPMTGKNTMYIVLGIGAAIVTGAAALHFVNRKKRNEV